ncbi:MAG: glutamate synthase large subunit [Deltaproteobacteria bacterium]|nr:glutamate synthase large subunit [Deltaproteobacteria bacterium]
MSSRIKKGLYDPWYEHDSCGVSFVVDIQGRKSHDIVKKALTALIHLRHRGACGCEKNTGDGAGILLQIPHDFFAHECSQERSQPGFDLPKPGEYGIGMIFFPQNQEERGKCEKIVEAKIREEGTKLLGWRDVPTDNRQIGLSAKTLEPVIRQVFMGRGEFKGDPAAFERKLYVIRRSIENAVAAIGLQDPRSFHIPSFSSNTVIYKGMLIADQIEGFYSDLVDPKVKSALALVHSRFSTNTFPTWDRAHPFRYLCHNGEINTLRGNINWMHAREEVFTSDLLGEDIKKIIPVIQEGGSDSAMFDNALEMLVMTGRSLPHAMMMMIPEAWENHESMDEDKKAFYEYHSCLMEPWDGPASIAFTDGTRIGAVLDRNGLRPSRYYVTKDGLVVMASEVGVLDIAPENILVKERLHPGRMLLIDTEEGRIIEDQELKSRIVREKPYRQWLQKNLVHIKDLPEPPHIYEPDHATILKRQQIFGYTHEDLRILMTPMAIHGEEPIGSMGNDVPLAVLSNRPQPFFNYFKQLFAQVTNPPLDSIREELVTSTHTRIGSEGDILHPTEANCRRIRFDEPILSNEEFERLRHVQLEGFKAVTVPMLYRVAEGSHGLEKAIEELCQQASQAVAEGCNILILSDRGVSKELAPIPSLLATAGVHHYLIREGTRTKVGLVMESGEPREVHHFCLLLGYGASAINPYLAFETLDDLLRDGKIPSNLGHEKIVKNYRKAVKKGVIKVTSKMGISTIQSYRGAQIFEAIGLNQEFVDKYFTWTATRIGGVGIDVIAKEVELRHRRAFPEQVGGLREIDWGGQYQWRRDGEFHLFNPETIFQLQHAARSKRYDLFKQYAERVDSQSRELCTLRGLFELNTLDKPIPLEEVEPASNIVKRFATGAMSLGSISREAHETLAIAMNRIGGRSNTGEGGEDPARYVPDPNGDRRRSSIKQVASARFGVTSEYLVNADELQIKIAQGAKPGEGGQLPGHKVDEYIAKIRNSTPGVALISPPPHHDIYSIEDLAQLIFDLKNANPEARVSVKLVASVGVGTIAAGVAKAHSDVILIAGHDGGTGASPLTSIKHAGVPWELGLAETQQVLVENKLRGRVVVQADGQMKTGRDVVIAALLGAEEYGFSTAALVVEGCIMMRVCHLNTCPVGIATQDPELRKRYTGKAEHVVNFFYFVAEQVRELMAQLGFRTMNEMIGRVDKLKMRSAIDHWKARGLDFSKILRPPQVDEGIPIRKVEEQDHGIDDILDHRLIAAAKPALENGAPVSLEFPIRNVHRTTGTMLGYHLTKKYGGAGLPDNTLQIKFTGSAGQSFGAFLPKGITFELEGDANDYFAKGISGGKITVYPPRRATFKAEENIVIGNVALYGATSGEVFVRGLAGERFAVRNSGAHAVVEGVGDHGCEYMTGGRVVVLGPTGRNFAAGMSGGIAYVLDEKGDFKHRCNLGMVELERLGDEEEVEFVRSLIERHLQKTGSASAQRVLEVWGSFVPKFVKVMPIDYKRVLQERKQQNLAA